MLIPTDTKSQGSQMEQYHDALQRKQMETIDQGSSLISIDIYTL